MAEISPEAKGLILVAAAVHFRGKPLTGFELFEILGVEDPENQRDSVLKNACLHAATNPRVQALPEPEAIRAVATAANMLDHLI